MSIRIRPSIVTDLSQKQIAALITQSILTPTQDDAPHAESGQPTAGWLGWGQGLKAPRSRAN